MAQVTGRNLPPPQSPFVDTGTLNLSFTGYQYLLSVLALASSQIATSTISSSASAAGANQATAAALSSQWNNVNSVPSGSGVLLQTYQPGQSQIVWNAGTHALLVYPPPGSQIDTSAVNAAYSLAPGGMQVFSTISSTQINSFQLG